MNDSDMHYFVHEASHAVVGWGHGIQIIRVNSHQTEFAGGSAEPSQGYATMLLAGSVGQSKWLNRPYSLVHRAGLDDLMKLTRLFRKSLGSQLVSFLTHVEQYLNIAQVWKAVLGVASVLRETSEVNGQAVKVICLGASVPKCDVCKPLPSIPLPQVKGRPSYRPTSTPRGRVTGTTRPQPPRQAAINKEEQMRQWRDQLDSLPQPDTSEADRVVDELRRMQGW
jgi:hypothetical protein